MILGILKDFFPTRCFDYKHQLMITDILSADFLAWSEIKRAFWSSTWFELIRFLFILPSTLLRIALLFLYSLSFFVDGFLILLERFLEFLSILLLPLVFCSLAVFASILLCACIEQIIPCLGALIFCLIYPLLPYLIMFILELNWVSVSKFSFFIIFSLWHFTRFVATDFLKSFIAPWDHFLKPIIKLFVKLYQRPSYQEIVKLIVGALCTVFFIIISGTVLLPLITSAALAISQFLGFSILNFPLIVIGQWIVPIIMGFTIGQKIVVYWKLLPFLYFNFYLAEYGNVRRVENSLAIIPKHNRLAAMMGKDENYTCLSLDDLNRRFLKEHQEVLARKCLSNANARIWVDCKRGEFLFVVLSLLKYVPESSYNDFLGSIYDRANEGSWFSSDYNELVFLISVPKDERSTNEKWASIMKKRWNQAFSEHRCEQAKHDWLKLFWYLDPIKQLSLTEQLLLTRDTVIYKALIDILQEISPDTKPTISRGIWDYRKGDYDISSPLMHDYIKDWLNATRKNFRSTVEFHIPVNVLFPIISDYMGLSGASSDPNVVQIPPP